MNIKIQEINEESLRKEKLNFSVGDVVKVYNKIKEGTRERTQVYEGVVIKKCNGNIGETFTVRKDSNGIGVEKTFPINSPMVLKVEVVKKAKVRRAKLNFLRQKVGKDAKLKEVR
ncbi:MAG: 50S ribosomal protein L19 [Eubacteriales bacterium]|nr:50S ribosomal protein L19 [Eubacteriales bacterium]